MPEITCPDLFGMESLHKLAKNGFNVVVMLVPDVEV
jgi:hypothetical protein